MNYISQFGQSIRPWKSEFLLITSFQFPLNSNAFQKSLTNISHFRSNYALIILIIFSLGLWNNLGIIILLFASIILWIQILTNKIQFFITDEPITSNFKLLFTLTINLLGFILIDGKQLFILLGISMLTTITHSLLIQQSEMLPFYSQPYYGQFEQKQQYNYDYESNQMAETRETSIKNPFEDDGPKGVAQFNDEDSQEDLGIVDKNQDDHQVF